MRTCLIVIAVGLFSGCGFIATDQGQLNLVADDTLVGAPATLQDAVWLEGMALCLSCGEVLIGEGLGCSDVSDCLEWSVDGVALDADHCIDTTIPGIHTLELTPVACAADPGFVDDIRAFEVVSAADVSAEIDQWPEDWAQAWEGSLELTGGGFDTAWFHPEGTPWQIAKGQAFRFSADLIDDNGRHVALNTSEASWRTETIAGGDPMVQVEAGHVYIALPKGASARLFFAAHGTEWEVAEVVGVDEDSAESIEVIAAVVRDDVGNSSPWAARAIVRDATGAPIYGAPVVWASAVGSLRIDHATTTPGADYVGLAGDCESPKPQPNARSEVVSVTLGDLQTETTVSWMAAAEDAESWLAHDDCTAVCAEDTRVVYVPRSRCGCQPGGAPNGLWWLVLPLVALRRRR